MVKRIIISVILVVVLSLVLERLLSFFGFGFTLVENLSVLLIIACLFLFNELRHAKEKSEQLEIDLKAIKGKHIEEVTGLKKMFDAEQERCRKDRAVYDRLIKIVPPDGSISFLRKGSYLITLFEPEKQLKDFLEFERIYKDDPLSFYFQNSEIQRHNLEMSRTLIAAIAKISDCLFENADGLYAFNLDLKPSEGYADVVEEVSDLVGEFLEKYDELRMAVREDLGCTWI